jgi:hypothetical protein
MHTQNHSHPHTPHESPDTELHRHQLACLCADGSLEGVDFILGHSPDLIHQPLAQSW